MNRRNGNWKHRWKRQLVTVGTVVGALAALSVPVMASENALTDKQVCHAVEDRLFLDQAVPFNRVDARCSNGVVTLTGRARNLLAKQRAARLAETIKGVRTVVNRIELKPLKSRSSEDLKNDIKAAFVSDPATESYEIDVETDDSGRVTLTGTVDSWQEKELAGKVAAGVNGVTDVKNILNVDYDVDRPEQEIKPEVEKALRWNALVDEGYINVEVSGRTVILSGTVGSAAEKRHANYEAWVAGVRHVDDDHLAVRDWAKDPERRKTDYPTLSNSAVEQAVTDANIYDPRVLPFDIEPEVIGSTVVLRGTVDNVQAKRAAAENARNTVGVSVVRNRIKVRPAVDRPDAKIEQDLRSALRRDPYLDRYEINVSAVDGTAVLAGTVDTYFEKVRAENVANRVKGVVAVSNTLTVSDQTSQVLYDPYVYDYDIYDYGWYDYDPVQPAKPDAEIEKAIEDQLWWSPFVDSDDIDVEVIDGKAKLTGTVDSWVERRTAQENCLEGGAVRVENRLKIRYR